MKWRLLRWAILGSLLLPFAHTPAAYAGSLSVEPLREELELKPGQTVTNRLIVRNVTDKPATVSLSAESFNVVNEAYDYSFAQSEDLKNWVHFDESNVLLPAKGSHLFSYTVGAPNNSEPGAKYIAIFSTSGAASSGAVTSIERAGTLLYITVPGRITKQGSIVGSNVPHISFRRSTTLTLRLHNTGSAHFKSRLTMEVRTLFGGVVESQTDEHLLLPGTIRQVTEPIHLGSLPGLYRLKVTVGQGDSPATILNPWILYIPPIPTTFLLIMLALATQGLRNLVHRRHNKTAKH